MKRVLGLVVALLLSLGPVHAQEDAGGTPDGAPATNATPAADEAGEAGEPTEATEADEADPAGEAVDETAAEDAEDYVVVCPIEGEIDEGVVVVVKRAVREAKNAKALLFVINTPGGRVDSAIEITSAIMSVECPTIAYIEGMGAISAGAIISFACDEIYMQEGTNIGASTPIMPGVETTEAMDEKSNSFVRGKYRALGEANGHNPLLGEAMVDRNIELRGYRGDDGEYYIFKVDEAERDRNGDGGRDGDVLDKILDAVSDSDGENEDISEVLKKVLGAAAGKGEEDGAAPTRAGDGDAAYEQFIAGTDLISARGDLLTMTSKEAVHVDLAEGITEDVGATFRELYLGTTPRRMITPSWDEALFAFLTSPTIAGLLLMAGLGGIYVEVRTPGFGAPGIIGATCLALFFGAHMVLGMASWIDVALILAGFLLILAEIFVLPGFGIAGVLGFVCLLGGTYLALVKAPIPEFTWEFQHFNDALYTLTITATSLIAFVAITGLLLPYTPIGRALMLTETQQADAGYVIQTADRVSEAMGLTGVALSTLRPAGKGRFGKTKYDIVTRGEYIDEGTPIKIIESSGNRYVVTEIKEDTGA